jgi:nucleotide-binding universal stress UspA family protein
MNASPVNQTVDVDRVPTSFGVFKPVGWVMVGVPTQAQADALALALGRDGSPSTAVLHFTPSETEAELQAMADDAGGLAGFGYEITLLRRYVELSRQGYRWLLVKVDGTEQAAIAAGIAQSCGATLAVHYRTLTVEDLI